MSKEFEKDWLQLAKYSVISFEAEWDLKLPMCSSYPQTMFLLGLMKNKICKKDNVYKFMRNRKRKKDSVDPYVDNFINRLLTSKIIKINSFHIWLNPKFVKRSGFFKGDDD